MVDLGCDSIYHYKMSDTNLTQNGVTKVGDGRGPRHMITIEERGLALVVCELENYLQVDTTTNYMYLCIDHNFRSTT